MVDTDVRDTLQIDASLLTVPAAVVGSPPSMVSLLPASAGAP